MTLVLIQYSICHSLLTSILWRYLFAQKTRTKSETKLVMHGAKYCPNFLAPKARGDPLIFEPSVIWTRDVSSRTAFTYRSTWLDNQQGQDVD